MIPTWKSGFCSSCLARRSIWSNGAYKSYLSRPGIRWSSSESAPSSLPPFDHTRSFRLTKPPEPLWDIRNGGDRKGIQEEPRKTWDLSTMPMKDSYRLLTSAIVPRPIAFVSSLSAEGFPNLAPFSYFSMVSANPPLLSISFSLSPRRPKDTRENILSTKEFTVNIISENFVGQANSTSVEASADIDEWLISGLSMEPSVDVKPAYVRESAVSMECELYSSQDISPSPDQPPTCTLVLGLIKRVHVHKSVLVKEDDCIIDPGKLRPVARMGGTTYSRVIEGFDLPRVSWKGIRESGVDVDAYRTKQKP